MAKIQGLMGLIFGALFGVLFGVTFVILAILANAAGGEKDSYILLAFAVGYGLGMPIIYGGMGFFMGAVGTFIYNILAKKIGGIKIELAEDTTAA